MIAPKTGLLSAYRKYRSTLAWTVPLFALVLGFALSWRALINQIAAEIPEGTRKVREAIIDDDPDVVEKFLAVRPRFRKFVVRSLLLDTNDLVRATTYDLMWVSHQTDWSGEFLRDGLQDLSFLVRYHAANLIVQTKRVDYAYELCSAYRIETNSQLRTEFIRALTELGSTSCLKLATARSESERLALAYAEYASGNQTEADFIAAISKVPPNTRSAFAVLAGYFGGTRGERVLDYLVHDEDRDVQAHAQRAMERLKSSRESLKRLNGDTSILPQ